MKSTKEKPSSKKALFEAVKLTKNFALVQSNDLAKTIAKAHSVAQAIYN